MGWMRYLLLGDLGQQLDIGNMQQRLEDMEGSKAHADLSQDKRIAALAGENRDLKLRLGVLIKLLIAKNLLTAQEIADMIVQLEPEGREAK
jgi:hypothetical protein